MAGGNALSRRLSEVAASDEAKALKMQAEFEAQQDAALQKKKKDRQEQQQLLLQTRQQQVNTSFALLAVCAMSVPLRSGIMHAADMGKELWTPLQRQGNLQMLKQ